jgi:hypothetical protein
MEMEQEFKTKYLYFLENFNKYGNEYQNIYNVVKNITFEKEYIKKLTTYLESNEIQDFKLFQKTNIKDIWEDIDKENIAKYNKDLQETIAIGKLLSLGDLLQTTDENKEEETINDIQNMMENILQNNDLESYKNMIFGKDINVEDIFNKVKDEFINTFPQHFETANLLKSKVDVMKKLEEYLEKIKTNVDFDFWKNKFEGISLNMKNPKACMGQIMSLVNEIKSNPQFIDLIKNILDDIKQILVDNDVDLQKLVIDNGKIYSFVTSILNKCGIDPNKFEFMRMILKQLGVKQAPKVSDKKKKEKRRAKARCNYRKQLRKKYNKKRRN